MINLEELGKKYGTDKYNHGYLPYYQKHLPFGKKNLKILEIGCFKGASLRMWHEAFPDASLYTLDLFIENEPPQDLQGIVKFIKGSQTDKNILFALQYETFDVIIDDGSHNSMDQLITYRALADHTSLYVIEDLHCCTEEFYRQGLKFEETMLGILQAKNHPHLYNDKIAFL